MARIALMDRTKMSGEQARVYDAAKAAGGPLGGPYHAYVHVPRIFEAAQNMRACFSPEPLSRREQQIVNVTVSRHWGARYPWYAQVRNALAMGIPQEVVDAINARQPPNLPDVREKTCYAVARELLETKGLSDESYAAAEKTMGLQSLVALVAATSSFSMTCLTANAFQIDPPADDPTPLAE